jgi:hypothetical protein
MMRATAALAAPGERCSPSGDVNINVTVTAAARASTA